MSAHCTDLLDGRRNLAKVRVAGSNPVVRSRTTVQARPPFRRGPASFLATAATSAVYYAPRTGPPRGCDGTRRRGGQRGSRPADDPSSREGADSTADRGVQRPRSARSRAFTAAGAGSALHARRQPTHLPAGGDVAGLRPGDEAGAAESCGSTKTSIPLGRWPRSRTAPRWCAGDRPDAATERGDRSHQGPSTMSTSTSTEPSPSPSGGSGSGPTPPAPPAREGAPLATRAPAGGRGRGSGGWVRRATRRRRNGSTRRFRHRRRPRTRPRRR